MLGEYIMLPIKNRDTKPEESQPKTTSWPFEKVLANVKVYDQKEESKRLIKELNEMVAKWK